MKEKPFSAGITITLADSSGSNGVISLRKPEGSINQFPDYLTTCQEVCKNCDPGDNIHCETINLEGRAHVTIFIRGIDIGVELDKGHAPCTKYNWISNRK
jgi:hypothetical protein